MIDSTDVTLRTSTRRPVKNMFFAVASTIMLLIVLIAFSRTYYFRPLTSVTDLSATLGQQRLPWYLLAHGAILTIWYAIFCTQSWLATFRQIGWHRRLGMVGIAISAAVTVSTVSTTALFVPRALTAGRSMGNVSAIVVGNFLLQASFVLFVSLAVYWRRWPDRHKRLMYYAAIASIKPAFAAGDRVVGAFLGRHVPMVAASNRFISVLVVGVLALLLFDWATERRIRFVTLVPGLLLMTDEFAAMHLAPSSWGWQLVNWFS